MHRYCVDICSGPSGILGSDRKQNTSKVSATRGVRIVALSIRSHEQSQ